MGNNNNNNLKSYEKIRTIDSLTIGKPKLIINFSYAAQQLQDMLTYRTAQAHISAYLIYGLNIELKLIALVRKCRKVFETLEILESSSITLTIILKTTIMNSKQPIKQWSGFSELAYDAERFSKFQYRIEGIQNLFIQL